MTNIQIGDSVHIESINRTGVVVTSISSRQTEKILYYVVKFADDTYGKYTPEEIELILDENETPPSAEGKETLDPFEKNSIHLMSEGYIFAMARLHDDCVDGVPACVMPMWIKEDDATDTEKIRAILGSEPKIGEHPEVELDRVKIKQLVFSTMKGVLYE